MDIKLVVDLKSPELSQKKEYNGTFEENRILYNDDTSVIIDLDKKKLRRDIQRAHIRTNEIIQTQNYMAQDRKRKQSRGMSR